MKGIDKIISGRVRLLFDNPFFGTLATSLKLIETEAVPTAATDGIHLLFNPNFTNKLSKSEILFLICHEVLHLVLLTHLRRGNRDIKVWNMATDYAINQLLADEKFHTLDTCLLDEKYKEWSAEKIYDHLMKNSDEQPKTGKDDWNIGEVMDGGTIGEDGEPGQGTPMTVGEAAVAEQDMKAKIQGAVMAAKKAGNLPGSLERLVDNICAPKASWKEILQRFIAEKAFNDWEYGTCNTRLLSQYGIISPVLGGEALGRLSIIVDTSGSVDEEQLAQFAGEINDILENYDCEINVVYCDTQVNRTDEFNQDDLPLRLNAVGGGGTMGRPAYEWIAERVEESAAIIHYTDSYLFDWNQIEQPECPVLMACTSKHINDETPDWIEVIDISE